MSVRHDFAPSFGTRLQMLSTWRRAIYWRGVRDAVLAIAAAVVLILFFAWYWSVGAAQ